MLSRLDTCRVVQDAAAEDGTTSVVVICGALLKKALELLEMGIHPTLLSDGFAKAAVKAVEVSMPVYSRTPCKLGRMFL